MHKQAYNYFARWFAPKNGDRVLEVGSMDINSTQQGLVLRELGKNTEWIGIDIEEGPSVDIVIKPNEPWPFEPESFDWVLLPEMLEHDANPSTTLDEVYTVLKPSGWLILTAAAGGRQHHNPPHYWNFWPEGIERLVTIANLKAHHIELLGLDVRCCAIRPKEALNVEKYIIPVSGRGWSHKDYGRLLRDVVTELAVGVEYIAKLEKTVMPDNWLDKESPPGDGLDLVLVKL